MKLHPDQSLPAPTGAGWRSQRYGYSTTTFISSVSLSLSNLSNHTHTQRERDKRKNLRPPFFYFFFSLFILCFVCVSSSPMLKPCIIWLSSFCMALYINIYMCVKKGRDKLVFGNMSLVAQQDVCSLRACPEVTTYVNQVTDLKLNSFLLRCFKFHGACIDLFKHRLPGTL